MPWVKSKIIFLRYKTLPGMPSTLPTSKAISLPSRVPPPPVQPCLPSRHSVSCSSLLQVSRVLKFQQRQNHLEDLLKHRLLGLICRIFGFSRSGGGPKPAFRTSSPTVLVLLLQSPHLENHWTINYSSPKSFVTLHFFLDWLPLSLQV